MWIFFYSVYYKRVVNLYAKFSVKKIFFFTNTKDV